MVSKIIFVFLNLIITLFCLKVSSENVTPNSWVGSKYEIECKMCAACDNPCASPSPPPPPPSSPPPPPMPSPPPPSPPSTPSSTNCPPPPSPPSSGSYYYPPPPPYSAQYPPPTGIIGGTNPPPYMNFPAPPYKNFPAPPPPNPIVGYFPFYYHNPPPSASLSTKLIPNYVIVLIFSFVFVF